MDTKLPVKPLMYILHLIVESREEFGVIIFAALQVYVVDLYRFSSVLYMGRYHLNLHLQNEI